MSAAADDLRARLVPRLRSRHQAGPKGCLCIYCMAADALDAKDREIADLKAELDRLRVTISLANGHLLDALPLDPEHEVSCHADTLPKSYLDLDRGIRRALDPLQAVISEAMDDGDGTPNAPPTR